MYDIEDGKIIKTELINTNGSGHGALAGVLSAVKADVLICGGIGGGAQMALAENGIKLYGGVSGNADLRKGFCCRQSCFQSRCAL